ncbi:DUF4099 domain-containing protein [Mucilaginibacter sp. cycad4]|uniref:DUF4099 domain-containing protein n=1 Tax=Mucilaginibacter sp. cycad4 TaxID=3342096 RepID=UPI002AAAE2FC|nr:DUF4099 domain-containing protein [Mucilaginibacter gossypii]WPU99113.1 DUF4099 domain-containing protein [Mucilaginibacter gossypii]
MNLISYNENKLPIDDLETIGLAAGGQLLLNVDDLKALLSGRRTGLLQLDNLQAENIRIQTLDAKLSLQPDATGKLDLVIHPVYRKAVTPDFLEENEAQLLQSGEVENFLKITIDNIGNKKELLVEYDSETREFIVSDTEKILAPDMVNGEFLTPAQKENYRKGKEVELPDSTTFNYSGKDIHGIRSNKLALVASILIDGGLSYVLYKGLNALFNKKRDPKEAAKQSPAFQSALKDMINRQQPEDQHFINFYSQEEGNSR